PYGYPDLGSGCTRTGGDYSFDGSAADPSEPNDVTATNGAGLASAPTSFTVTPDGTAPSTTIACDGAACAGWHTAAPVSVTLDAADTASGVTEIRYTTDGGDPTLRSTESNGPAVDASQTTTVKVQIGGAHDCTPVTSQPR